ncbi:MAG: DegT/DnrJ/EryC1/StrS family aminotransferase [Clostridia bacterium]|nr:DegT/DnrJ/EryC1/StrS family aminotransferase [Clostridia bacterium]
MEKRNISFNPPDIGQLEIDEVINALTSGWITTGVKTKKLERRLAAYIETGRTDIDTDADRDKWKERVACLNSATASEELNLRILGVGPGDEVIVPAYTYTATASVVEHCGAKIVFVDIQKSGDPKTHSPEMDYDKLEAAITEKTKAIVAVDFGGIICDYDRIFEIAERKRSLFKAAGSDGTVLGDLSSKIQKSLGRAAVIADGAHALGASRVVSHSGSRHLSEPTRKMCGAIADATSFSFHAVKNFTTAEGGAAAWAPIDGVDIKEIYSMLQLMSLHGQDKDAFSKNQAAKWEYDIIGPWYKYNMSDVIAAIGIRQLDRYLKLLRERARIMARYDQTFDALGASHLVHHTDYMESGKHLYTIRIPSTDEKERNEIIKKFAAEGISTNVHYKPLPMMTAYKHLGFDISDFPNSYDYYKNTISIPFNTMLNDEDVEYICDVFKEVLKQYMK